MKFRGDSYGPMAPLPCFQGSSYGPMGLKARQKFPPRLALVHRWLFPEETRQKCHNQNCSGAAPANQTKETAKTKSSWISPIFVNSGVFLRNTSMIHIELLFRNAPAKSSWTDLSLVWFARATPEMYDPIFLQLPGTDLRQDLAILSQKGWCDNTCQLWL